MVWGSSAFMGKSGLLFYDTSGWSLLRKSYTKSAFGSMYCDSKTDRSYCANRVSSRHVLEDLGDSGTERPAKRRMTLDIGFSTGFVAAVAVAAAMKLTSSSCTPLRPKDIRELRLHRVRLNPGLAHSSSSSNGESVRET
ncbi:uncharacterized protein LOC111243236 [Varroa destructor]|uniref:Uncharacterized protein n=1 Tax=Varroa destructor TaxID=109461 RepID=A0A7M7J0G3_VARDE|nr:uncharacterized protein LOC111243236 [Varroa destructor]XP_022644189.1 uncharacterized protein LOC111243236 [Varroa destructor]